MDRPTVSVLIPAYNAEQYIDEAIESVLNQTFQDFEIIVVNDGSTDETRTRLADYEDEPRITVIDQDNAGPAAARNRCFNASNGNFIAILDADDRSRPRRLELQSQRLEEDSELGLVGSYAQKIKPGGDPLEILEVPLKHREIAARIDDSNQFVHATVMMRRSVFEELGGYREDYPASEDYEFLRRATHNFQTANIPEVLYDYRIHGESNTFYALKQQKLYGLMTRHLAKQNQSIDDFPELLDTPLTRESLVEFGISPRRIDEKLFSSYKRRVRVLVGLGDFNGARQFAQKAAAHMEDSVLGAREEAILGIYQTILSLAEPNRQLSTGLISLTRATLLSPAGALRAIKEWGHFGLYRVYSTLSERDAPPS